jgi:hypothetical protein
MHTEVPWMLLTQRDHGSKVEAKDSTENSKAFELDVLEFKS